MKKILIFWILVFSGSALAYDIKLRAREHYEILTIKDDVNTAKYAGLSNTVNLWFERPYDMSFGLSFSPVFSGLKSKDSSSVFGSEVQTYNIGFELKKFHKPLFRHAYIRPGLSYSILRPDSNLENLDGVSLYLGLGYEFAFNKFGLALEVAYRGTWLENSTRIQAITPSLGFHFYKNL